MNSSIVMMEDKYLKKVLYLTWGEQINLNGLAGNQVFKLLSKMASIDKNLIIAVVSGIPYFSRKRFFNPKKLESEYKLIEEFLQNNGISLTIRRVMVLPRWFYSLFYYRWLYTFTHEIFIKRFILKNKIEIIHCRSYHAAYLAVQVRRKYTLPVKIVFDTRGMFPEEGAFLGCYNTLSKSYMDWKKLEKKMIDECDMIVNVSTKLSDHYRGLTENNSIKTIYTSVDRQVFFKDSIIGEEARNNLNLQSDEKTLIYIGSIAPEGWHRVDTLVALYKAFKKVFIKSRLLVVTQSRHAPLREQFADYGLQEGDYLLMESSGPSETNCLLNAAHYSCMPYRKNQSELDALIGETVLATKTGEYFATGLPLLVNENAGEAAMLVEKHNLGIVYRAGEEDEVCAALEKLELEYDLVCRRCIEIAGEFFDADLNARKYLALYDELIKDRKETAK